MHNNKMDALAWKHRIRHINNIIYDMSIIKMF
jgi:hypothetical protein